MAPALPPAEKRTTSLPLIVFDRRTFNGRLLNVRTLHQVRLSPKPLFRSPPWHPADASQGAFTVETMEILTIQFIH